MSNKLSCLLPSPPRFNACIMDTSSHGFLAYGFRFNVLVLDIRERYFIHAVFEFHQERVSCLSFCKHKNTTHLAVGGELGTLKIWNVENRPILLQTFLVGKMRLNSVKWKPGSDYIGFVSHDQKVMEWDLLKKTVNQLRTSKFIKDEILCLECCPMEPNSLAVGYKRGSVAIFNTLNGSVIHELFHREQGVIYVAWSPHSETQILTCSTDGSVFVWTLSSKPTCETYVDPSTRRDGRMQYGRQWKIAIWHPLVTDSIIVSNFSGDISVHKLNSLHRKKAIAEGIHHSRMVCFIVASCFKKEMLISFGSDCQMLFWDLDLQKCVNKMYLVCSSVRSLQFCPNDESQLLIASTETSLRLWSVASDCDVKIFNNMSKTKVVIISWHPQISTLIGFATEEGRVGLFNIDKHRYGSFFNTTKHSSMVYSLCWGPYKKLSDSNLKYRDSNLCLFSCGGNRIYVNHPSNMDKDDITPFNFDDDADNGSAKDSEKVPERTEMCWKDDYTMVAVGNEEGHVDIYDGETLRLLAILQGSRKTVNSLRWHPQHISILDTKCPMHNWLAVATSEMDICVYDLAVLTDHTSSRNTSVMKILEPTRVLKGHTNRVSQIAWSLHVAGRLASASQDQTVQVWDVMSAQPIVNFQGHIGRVFAVEWSTLNPDIIYSGGDDNMVLKWRISEQVEMRPPGGRTVFRPKKKKKKHTQATEDVEISTEQDTTVAILNDEDKQQEASASTIHDKDIEMEAQHIVQGSRRERSRKKSFFPNFVSITSLTEENAVEIAIRVIDILAGDKEEIEKLGKDDLVAFGYFGNQSTAIAALDADTDKVSKNTSYDIIHAIWKGDAVSALREAAEKGHLNDYCIAVAPMISRTLWLELCDRYVEQLKKEENYHKAASFLLLTHKVYEAIHLIDQYIGPRDAFLLARVRLPHSDPLVKELLQKWCKQCVSIDRHLFGALCHLVDNDPLSAAKVMFRKLSAGYARLASYISLKYGHIKDSRFYALNCLKRIVCRKESYVLSDLISEHPELEGLQVLVDISDSISEVAFKIKDSAEQFGLVAKVLPTADDPRQDESVIWKSYVEDDEYYFLKLFSSILTEDFMDRVDVASSLELIKALLKEEEGNYHSKDAIYIISLKILACLYSLLIATTDDDILDSFQYICSVLHFCLDAHLINEFKLFCIIFFPFDIVWQHHDGVHNGTMILKQSSIRSGHEVLQSAFGRLSESIAKLFVKFEDLVYDGKTFSHKQENLSYSSILDELASTTVGDVILGFFAINFIECVWRQLCESEIKLLCDDSKKAVDGRSENLEIVGTVSSDVGGAESSVNICDVNALPESAEISSNGLLNIHKELDSEPEVPAAGDVVKSSPMLSGDASQSQEKLDCLVNVATDQIPHKDDHLEEENIAKNCLSPELHSNCDKSAKLFFHMLHLFSACSCRDIFRFRWFLKSLKDKTDADLLKLKIQDKLTRSSPTDNSAEASSRPYSNPDLASNSIPDADDPEAEKLGAVNSETYVDSEIKTGNDETPCKESAKGLESETYGNGEIKTANDEARCEETTEGMESGDASTEIMKNDLVKSSIVAMESRFELMVKMLSGVDQLTKVQNFPDSMLASKELDQLCNHVADKVCCPVFKPLLIKFSDDIKLWNEDFKAALERLIENES